MEMCYAGAIAMPSSYVVMNEEEMTYIDGGFEDIVVKKKFGATFGVMVLTSQDCAHMSAALTGGAAIGAAFSSICPFPYNAPTIIITLGIGLNAAYLADCAAYGGCVMEYFRIGKITKIVNFKKVK